MTINAYTGSRHMLQTSRCHKSGASSWTARLWQDASQVAGRRDRSSTALPIDSHCACVLGSYMAGSACLPMCGSGQIRVYCWQARKTHHIELSFLQNFFELLCILWKHACSIPQVVEYQPEMLAANNISRSSAWTC